jgi:hypothetical protein
VYGPSGLLTAVLKTNAIGTPPATMLGIIAGIAGIHRNVMQTDAFADRMNPLQYMSRCVNRQAINNCAPFDALQNGYEVCVW